MNEKAAKIKRQREVDRILKIDKEIWDKYNTSSEAVPVYPEMQNDNPAFAILWLERGIEGLLTQGVSAEVIRTELESRDMLETNPVYCSDKVRLYHIIKSVETRNNWEGALREVKKGTEISGTIDFGFTKKDISELAKLHKRNKFRRKIEELLEDCNFHYENGKFQAGEYDEFIKEEK